MLMILPSMPPACVSCFGAGSTTASSRGRVLWQMVSHATMLTVPRGQPGNASVYDSGPMRDGGMTATGVFQNVMASSRYSAGTA